jgi:hypothetical protein
VYEEQFLVSCRLFLKAFFHFTHGLPQSSGYLPLFSNYALKVFHPLIVEFLFKLHDLRLLHFPTSSRLTERALFNLLMIFRSAHLSTPLPLPPLLLTLLAFPSLIFLSLSHGLDLTVSEGLNLAPFFGFPVLVVMSVLILSAPMNGVDQVRGVYCLVEHVES